MASSHCNSVERRISRAHLLLLQYAADSNVLCISRRVNRPAHIIPRSLFSLLDSLIRRQRHAGPGHAPGTGEWRCLVTLARVARELIANRRVGIASDVMTANVIDVVRFVLRTPRPNVRISSRISINGTHFFVLRHAVLRLMRSLGERW